MFNWYRFIPVDTLFFRGSEPMSIGEDHSASFIFPPMPQTIAGALRTTVLIQNDIDFNDYKSGNVDKGIIEAIGKSGENAPFSIIGPLFLKENKLYVPAPYCWYFDKGIEKSIEKGCGANNVKIIESRKIDTDLIKTRSGSLYWAKPEEGELVSAGGYWVSLDELYSSDSKKALLPISCFVSFEQRVGIALEDNRRVRKSHIYSFTHARLLDGVEIVFGVDRELPIKDEGVMKLGAEQRFGVYEKVNEKWKLEDSGNKFVSLSAVSKSDEANSNVIATGKIIYAGGWDLAKGFHKPTKGYFPAGSVFSKKINSNCIGIKEVL